MQLRLSRRTALRALSSVALVGATALDAVPSAAGTRGWLGVELSFVDGRVVAKRVLRGSPAERAGIRDGDVFEAIDGVRLSSTRAVVESVAKAGAGAKIRISIRRANGLVDVVVVLDRFPGDEEILRLDKVGTFAPSFGAVRAVQGEVPEVARLRGRVVLVMFWASWCGACRTTIPSIEAVRTRFEPEGLTVLGLTDDDDATAALAAVKHGIKFAVGAGLDAETSSAWGVRALPTMFVLDRAGVVRDVMMGFRPADVLAAAIAPHLGARGAPGKSQSAR